MSLEPTLPGEHYLSPEIFARERERIFFREWFCAGREEQLCDVGDYLVLNVAGESVLVVRTKAQSLAAFYNVCRHRGSQLVLPAVEPNLPGTEADGCFGGTNPCPYHSWTYNLDGTLPTAPYIEDGPNLCKTDLPLYPVGVTRAEEFDFLNTYPM